MSVEKEDRECCNQPVSPRNFLPSWVFRIGSAITGAIGFSGLLYACGFVATRSHQTFWGFWSGPADEAPDIVAEGGRFLYHLSFVFVDLLNPFTIFKHPIFFTSLIFGVFLCIFPSLPLRRFIDIPSILSRILRVSITLVPAIVTYVFGWVVLANLANVMKPSNVLTLQCSLPPDFAKLFQSPNNVYFDLICEWFLLNILFLISLRAARFNSNVASKIVVVIGGLFLLAATSLLPAVYGRLILLPEYPLIAFTRDERKPVERVLIRMAGSLWVVWNLESRKVEVITLHKDELVTIGQRRLLSIPNNIYFQDGCDGKP